MWRLRLGEVATQSCGNAWYAGFTPDETVIIRLIVDARTSEIRQWTTRKSIKLGHLEKLIVVSELGVQQGLTVQSSKLGMLQLRRKGNTRVTKRDSSNIFKSGHPSTTVHRLLKRIYHHDIIDILNSDEEMGEPTTVRYSQSDER
jgi:hypothetical protein